MKQDRLRPDDVREMEYFSDGTHPDEALLENGVLEEPNGKNQDVLAEDVIEALTEGCSVTLNEETAIKGTVVSYNEDQPCTDGPQGAYVIDGSGVYKVSANHAGELATTERNSLEPIRGVE